MLKTSYNIWENLIFHKGRKVKEAVQIIRDRTLQNFSFLAYFLNSFSHTFNICWWIFVLWINFSKIQHFKFFISERKIKFKISLYALLRYFGSINKEEETKIFSTLLERGWFLIFSPSQQTENNGKENSNFFLPYAPFVSCLGGIFAKI